ncbi:MAG: T9SS type A sorting domain-containing protein, partial [Calditrichaeota bacterium]|nr:T9SS type A sorting domain-containing protein [Calditrichota bacterium]
ATLQDDLGDPVVARDVVIDVIAGPNAGLSSGILSTDGSGQVMWTYTSWIWGVDQAIASFLDSQGNPATSNIALVDWTRTVDAVEGPVSFQLEANHPNPFNPSTSIRFSMPETGMASLAIHDLQGRLVATLLDGMVEAGSHELNFDANGLASGSYVYTLRSEFGTQSRMMTLL